jgi:superfamily I DNA/RNA helicase
MNNHEDERHQPGIRISTMHRVKGLEFDYVIVADVDDDICPPKSAIQSASDAVALRELSKQERSLIYVALTRARKEAVLVGCGQPM